MDVVVIEDHPAFRYALEQVIERSDRLRLVGSFSDGEAAVAAISEAHPDLVLLDIGLPKLDGIGVLRRLGVNGRRTLVISANTDGEVVREALASGASGYLSKDADLDEIEAALLATADGATVLSPVAQNALADHLRNERTQQTTLTEREKQVLRLAATDATREEIGRRLHLSEATVKAHLAAAYQKLGVSSRAAAVAEAQRRGIIPDRRRPRS
jgi:two-component system, NarL family, nitrate/nitrite response regulator NarL